MTHPLSKYLDEVGLSQAEFARKAGLSRMHLWRLIRGKGDFSTSTLRKIEDATGGKVSLSDLIVALESPEAA